MKPTPTTTSPPTLTAIAVVMLRRFGLVAVPADSMPASTAEREAIELELANLGYVMSNRMRAACRRCRRRH